LYFCDSVAKLLALSSNAKNTQFSSVNAHARQIIFNTSYFEASEWVELNTLPETVVSAANHLTNGKKINSIGKMHNADS